MLVAQAIVETGRGRYGGDSRPWNMAGIKKGGPVGDAPKDFERPETAFGGVRMHVNHMAAYTHKRPIGAPHDRFHEARGRPESPRVVGQEDRPARGRRLAEDPAYARKIRYQLIAWEGFSRQALWFAKPFNPFPDHAVVGLIHPTADNARTTQRWATWQLHLVPGAC